MNLNFDKMFYNKMAKENKEMYGCSVPFHPISRSELTNEEIEICNDSLAGKKANDNFREARDANLLPDFTPCAEFNFFFGLPFIDKHDNEINESFIRLYMKTKIKIKSSVIYYDFTTFAAEIGGYVGMCLGISIVDLALKLHSTFLNSVNRLVN